jgi:hypothetical protein
LVKRFDPVNHNEQRSSGDPADQWDLKVLPIAALNDPKKSGISEPDLNKLNRLYLSDLGIKWLDRKETLRYKSLKM